MAYSRHYPAINWLNSYSGYTEMLKTYYEIELNGDLEGLRGKLLKLLFEESRLLEIVLLVGEDVLPDDQRLILEVAKVIKIGFLQQNAFHKVDTYVPLNKQFEMLKTIDLLYERGLSAIKMNIPISKVRNDQLYSEVIEMKYNIPNDNLDKLYELKNKIKDFYDNLEIDYREQ